MSKSRRKAKSFIKISGTGCVGIFLACFVVFVVAYERTGHYMPVISKQAPLPVPNAINDYIAAESQLRANGGIRILYDEDDHLIPQAEPAVVQANQGVLSRIRKGLEKECRVPFGQKSFIKTDILADGSDLFALLRAEGDVYARQQKFIHAAKSGLDLIQLGMDIQRGGSSNAAREGIRAESRGRQLIIQSVEKCDLADCNRIGTRLQGLILKRVSYAEILSQDRDWLLSYKSKISPARNEYSYVHLRCEPDEVTAQLRAMASHFTRDSSLRADEAGYTREIRESAKPTVLRRPIPESKAASENLKGWLTDLRQLYDEAELRNRLLLCAVALREFKLKHGQYPVSLAELKLDPIISVDPYTGKSIVYKPRGKDYLLYGVGEDGKDDGGVTANEALSPQNGDLGVSPFSYYSESGPYLPESIYKLVPHMLPPKLPAGAPPLKS